MVRQSQKNMLVKKKGVKIIEKCKLKKIIKRGKKAKKRKSYSTKRLEL